MAFSAGQASAMPALDHGLANTQGAQTAQVRWICGPWGRCMWRPGPYSVAMASTVRVLGAGAAAGVGAIIAVGGDSLIRSGGGISLRLFGVMARRASRARAAPPRRPK